MGPHSQARITTEQLAGRGLATTERPPGIYRPALHIGSRIPENAYSRDNALLLRAGTLIETGTQLLRLLQPDVRFGEYIPVETPEDSLDERALKGASATLRRRIEKHDPVVRHALALKREAVKNVQSVFGRIEAMGQVDMALARRTVASIMTELSGSDRTLTSLVQLKDADAYTFSHSVNVCILAMYIAERLGGEKALHDLGLGALLHDVGKLKIPPDILHKSGPLDADEVSIVKRHPTEGREILLASERSNEVMLGCVLDHHERVSGRGYPRGKRAGGISSYAQIVGLCDVFDALTTDRPYRKAMLTQEALALMEREMAGDLDPDLLRRFVALATPVVAEDDTSDVASEEDDDEPAGTTEIVRSSMVGIDLYG